MKGKKLAIVVAGVLVAATVLGALALKLFVDPESYRAKINTRLEQSLGGRKVELGALGVKIWPALGISIKDVKIGGLGPQAAPLLTADSLVVRAAFWPLLQKRLEITGVELAGPRVHLEKLGPEKWSISDLMGGTQEGDTAGADKDKIKKQDPASSASPLSVASIAVRDGRFTLVDKTAADQAPLEIVITKLTVKDALSDKPARVSATLGLASNPEALEIEGEAGPFTGENFQDRLSADLSGKINGLDLPGLAARLPAGTLPIKLESGILAGTFIAKGKAGQPIRAALDLTLEKFSYANAGNTWPVSKPQTLGLKLAAILDQAQDLLTIEPSAIALAGSKIDLAGTVAGIFAKHLKLNLKAKGAGLDLASLLELAPVAGQGLRSGGVEAKGPVSFDVTVTSGSTMNVDALVDLTAASVNVPGSFHKPAGANGRLKSLIILGQEKINLEKTSLALGPLDLNGGGVIARDDNLTSSLNFQSGSADTDQVFAMFPALDAYRLGGKMKLGLGISGALKQTESLAVKIDNLVQESEKASFNLDARALLTKPVQVNFNLKGDKLDLDKIMGQPAAKAKPEAKAAKSAGDGGGKTKKSAGAPSAVVTGDLSANKILYSGLDLTGLAASLKLKDGKLDLPAFKVNVLGGSVDGPMSFNLAQDPLPGQVNLALGGFVIEDLLKRFTSYPQVISGVAQGKLNLSFAGTSVSALKKTAGGGGTVDIQNGVIQGLDLVDGLLAQWAGSDAVKKVALQSLAPTLKRSVGDQTPFKEIDASVDLATGKIKLKRAVMEIAEGRAVFNGQIGLDASLNLSGEIHLSPEITKQVLAPAKKWIEKQSGGAISGAILDLLLVDGRLVLPFTLKGSWPKPALALDGPAYSKTVNQNLKNQPPEKVIENLVGEQGKKEIKKQKKKAEDEIRKQAGDLAGEEAKKILDGLFPE